jgi:hypothetical protein
MAGHIFMRVSEIHKTICALFDGDISLDAPLNTRVRCIDATVDDSYFYPFASALTAYLTPGHWTKGIKLWE